MREGGEGGEMCVFAESLPAVCAVSPPVSPPSLSLSLSLSLSHNLTLGCGQHSKSLRTNGRQAKGRLEDQAG